MKKTRKIICVILALLLTMSLGPFAIAAEDASEYLRAYVADCYYEGNSTVSVWFEVEGAGYVPYLGVLSIDLQEQVPGTGEWDTVLYVSDLTDATLLSQNDSFHYGSAVYDNAVEGYLYRAIVCFYGGEEESGDTRYYTTPTIVATP